MSNDLIDLVKAQKSFYRDRFYSMSTWLIATLIFIILGNLTIIILYIKQPSPEFYATSMDGKLVQLTPLGAPNYTSTPLI